MSLTRVILLKYFILICFSCDSGNAADFEFLNTTEQHLNVLTGDSLAFNCTTSDLSAKVSLWLKSSTTEKDVSKDQRVQLNGQVFTMQNITMNDGGSYSCKATNQDKNKIEMRIVKLIVVKPLGWIAKYNGAVFYVGDPLEFNCSLTQPWVSVSLWQNIDGSGYRQRIPDGHLRQNGQIFKIGALHKNDDGDYQCQAANIKAHHIWTVFVKKDGIPRPTPEILWEKKKIHRGDDVTMKCRAIGVVSLTWFKINSNGSMTELDGQNSRGTLLSGKRQTTNTITIKKFDESDVGHYRCLLERSMVKWRSEKDEFLSMGNEIPRFKAFPSDFNKEEGEDIYAEYEVSGSPPPSITWYKVNENNTEELIAKCPNNNSDVHCKKVVPVENMEILTYIVEILPVKYSVYHNKRFKCVIKNEHGSASRTFRIAVKVKPKLAKTEIDSEISTEVKVTCKIKEANPAPSYTWQIQTYSWCHNKETPNNETWKTVTNSGKYQVVSSSDKSTLTLRENRKTMFIRCTAKNNIGESLYTWRYRPTGIESIKCLRTSKKTVQRDEGTNVTLSCVADIFKFKKVIWERDNIDIYNSSRFTVKMNKSGDNRVYTLHIREANVADGGSYKCIGFRYDERNNSEVTSLIVKELKTPSVRLVNRTVKQSVSFKIPCNVTGYPQPNITWSKDGQLLSKLHPIPSLKSCSRAVKGIYRLSSENEYHNTVLIICKPDYKDHSGSFTCTAKNRVGSDFDSASIYITAAAKISPLKRKYEGKIGEPFSLSCKGSGNPRPSVWWEQKIGDEFKPLENAPVHELQYTAFEEKDLGVYRCVAKNRFGRDDAVIILAKESKTAKTAVSLPGQDDSKKYAVVIGCVSFAILIVVIVVAVILYKRKKIYGGFYILTLPPLPDYIKKLDPGVPLTEQTNKLPYDAEWEFPRNRLKFSRELGSGAFGKVFLAEGLGIVAFDPRGSTKQRSTKRRFGGASRRNHYVNNNKMTKVAVKTLKEDSGQTEYKDLLSELKILIHVGEHKNIVNLLGACTKGRESDLWVIIEFCLNGNLLQFLRNRRDIYETEWKGVSKDPNSQLTMTDLVIAAYQVARGMEFLASRMCIHRDLATRNILVTENYVIKIADFGLARDVGKDSQYVKTSTGLLPIKWMAIEAIIERLFTEKSDVWSFGIVLWELFTLGGTPYPNIPPNEVCEFLARGNRMEPPHACPEEIVNLMFTCWQDDRDDRPTFKELVEMLDKIIEVHTSSEGGCGYLEVQGDEVMSDYLRPSEVKSPQMDPFECNSPLPPIPSPGDNEGDSLLERDQNARNRGKKFNFDKSIKNRAARQDSELEKVENDRKPENAKEELELKRRGSDIDGYIDTSLTGKERERRECDLDKDRDSSEEPHLVDNYAYWKKSVV